MVPDMAVTATVRIAVLEIYDGENGLDDLAKLSEYWLSGCTEGNGWCDGMDYDHADGVNIDDLYEFASRWMVE
jgi:hypothetical protein